jgi:hypothetical protein
MTSVQSEKVPKEHPNTTALTSGFVGHALQQPFDNWELRPVIKFSFTNTVISYKTPAIADIQVSYFRLNICYIYEAKHRTVGCHIVTLSVLCVCMQMQGLLTSRGKHACRFNCLKTGWLVRRALGPDIVALTGDAYYTIGSQNFSSCVPLDSLFPKIVPFVLTPPLVITFS